VASSAAARGVAVLTPSRLRDPETVATLAQLDAGLMVLADYGRLVSPQVLEMPLHGALNIHPSLLPRHRGASPVAAAILAGDTETGVTVMRMDAGLDTGPLIAQERRPLRGDERTPGLEAELAETGASLLMAQLPAWLDGRLAAVPQASDGVTLTRPLRRADGLLDASAPAAALERQVRAYQPWPGSFLEADGGRLVVWRVEVADGDAGSGEPGDLVADGDGLALLTAAGRLRLLEVQPAGRTRMSGADYRRGRRP
jgi:methionyl-tRNA formyltransferase